MDNDVAGTVAGNKFPVIFGFVDYLDGRINGRWSFTLRLWRDENGYYAGPTHNEFDCNPFLVELF